MQCLNLKSGGKNMNSIDYGTTKYFSKYSYEICPSCESDLVDGKCVICQTSEEEWNIYTMVYGYQ